MLLTRWNLAGWTMGQRCNRGGDLPAWSHRPLKDRLVEILIYWKHEKKQIYQ
jgi:hypothetical protein